MKRSKLVLLLLAAVSVAGGARGTRVLNAQELRCWDVVCAVDGDGTMHCVETPKPCPNVT